MSWLMLGATPPGSLVEVRNLCHQALQVGTRVARAYIPAESDDSHTSFVWNPALKALVGREIASATPPFRFGLRLPDLALLFLDGNDELLDIKLAGSRKLMDLDRWATGFLKSNGLDPARYHQPLHFTIPPNAVARGAIFILDGRKPALEELSAWYFNAAAALDPIRQTEGGSEVRCWPHHFDLATLITLPDGKSIGAGLSPGDDSYPQPYFYVTPWPYPEGELPDLPQGHWHREGWTGAVLTGDRVTAAADQAGAVTEFLGGAVAACRKLVS